MGEQEQEAHVQVPELPAEVREAEQVPQARRPGRGGPPFQHRRAAAARPSGKRLSKASRSASRWPA
eukprot:4557026-Lingulodinium_polyedra.AAC.1